VEDVLGDAYLVNLALSWRCTAKNYLPSILFNAIPIPGSIQAAIIRISQTLS